MLSKNVIGILNPLVTIKIWRLIVVVSNIVFGSKNGRESNGREMRGKDEKIREKKGMVKTIISIIKF